ncbi:MAG: hypothetical protein HW380_3905 [Magnetococcales bacterium]|nr:hypothetical protein [Magnetococcales bacterium]
MPWCPEISNAIALTEKSKVTGNTVTLLCSMRKTCRSQARLRLWGATLIQTQSIVASLCLIYETQRRL